MIQIENLTPDQVDMLDMMWSLDTLAEYNDWYETLSTEDQTQADLLQRMVILAEIDNAMMNDDLTQAQNVLKKFALQ